MLSEALFKTARLCVIGNINRDLKTAPFRPGEHLFDDGETPLIAIDETIGGGGANSAAIAAALGAQVSFLGQVGGDDLGRRLRDALVRQGVRCHLHTASALPTGSTLNLVYDTGRRHFLSCHPNNASLALDALDLSPLTDAGHLLRADVWFSESMLYDGNAKLFQKARELGLAISLDLNWDPLWGTTTSAEMARRKQAVRRLLSEVSLAHGNARELLEFTDATDLRTALRRLEEWGVGAVVVHLGADGAGYYAQGELAVEPAVSVAQPLQVTGTGDVLSVCLMLLHHYSDVPSGEKLRLGNQIVAEFMTGRRKLLPAL